MKNTKMIMALLGLVMLISSQAGAMKPAAMVLEAVHKVVYTSATFVQNSVKAAFTPFKAAGYLVRNHPIAAIGAGVLGFGIFFSGCSIADLYEMHQLHSQKKELEKIKADTRRRITADGDGMPLYSANGTLNDFYAYASTLRQQSNVATDQPTQDALRNEAKLVRRTEKGLERIRKEMLRQKTRAKRFGFLSASCIAGGLALLWNEYRK